MSAIFKDIKRVKVNDYPDGRIGNCFIYNLSFSQNYSASPSTLSISALPENINAIALPDISLQTEYIIRIDNEIVFSGFLITKEIDESRQSKTVKLSFSDKSLRLDQYGIGLAQRHGEGVSGASDERKLEINCAHCTKPNTIIKKYATITRSVKEGGVWDGNVFLIGKQRVSENAHDILDVNYDDGDFQEAFVSFFEKTGLQVSSPPSVAPKSSFTGTFREVLNSVCSDQALSFLS